MAQIHILLLCVLSLKIIGLHASSSTHTSVDINVTSINLCRKIAACAHTPANKICRQAQEMRSIVMSQLKQNAFLHYWPDHTFELLHGISKRMILSSTVKLTPTHTTFLIVNPWNVGINSEVSQIHGETTEAFTKIKWKTYKSI